MGTECSVDRSNFTTDQPDNNDLIKNSHDTHKLFSFESKSYKEYSNKMENLKVNIKEILKKVEIANDFDLKLK